MFQAHVYYATHTGLLKGILVHIFYNYATSTKLKNTLVEDT
jgi:hypothetical protein